jgi:hypothetical protein
MCKQLFDTRQQAQALQMLNSEIICRKWLDQIFGSSL